MMASSLRKIMLLLCVLFALQCEAQDSNFVRYILQRIAYQQATNKTTSGNFPSFISNNISTGAKQQDDNVFFAALINYLLQQNSSSFTLSERLLIDSIRQRTQTVYPHFKNRTGRLTYNFWRTDTAGSFPYTKWIRKVKKNTSLPDDMDDTVLSLMAQNADSAMAAEAHGIMQGYINKGKNSKTIERKYRSYKAYSVWYGKQFPPVSDVCVLSNVLSFAEQYHLTWTRADSASLQVIVQAIKSSDYVNQPLYVSPYYGNTSIILYHLARLMENNRIPELDSLKTVLIVCAVKQWNATNDLLQKIILSTAIMKWGYTAPALDLPAAEQTVRLIEKSSLPFFVGNIPSCFPQFYKHLFTQKQWLLFYHYCPAFNDALLIEYLSLLKKDAQ